MKSHSKIPSHQAAAVVIWGSLRHYNYDSPGFSGKFVYTSTGSTSLYDVKDRFQFVLKLSCSILWNWRN